MLRKAELWPCNFMQKFTDKQLLDGVKTLKSFKGYPKGYWVIAVRSKANLPNVFDDKFYLFKGVEFVMVWPGTTNAGKTGLNRPVNKKGCAVLKSDEIYYDAWERGTHKKKIWGYVQVLNLWVWRDNDRDDYAEEGIGELELGPFGINLHPNDYHHSQIAKRLINGWSVGCLVAQVASDHDDFMKKTVEQKRLTIALLKEETISAADHLAQLAISSSDHPAAIQPENQTEPPPGTLERGAKGEPVRTLQYRLHIHGYLKSSDIDGDFGKKTDLAVRGFQAANNLRVDGKVGNNTKKALGAEN